MTMKTICFEMTVRKRWRRSVWISASSARLAHGIWSYSSLSNRPSSSRPPRCSSKKRQKVYRTRRSSKIG